MFEGDTDQMITVWFLVGLIFATLMIAIVCS